MNVTATPSKPTTYVARLDIEAFTFKMKREQFIQAIDLELEFIVKEMREVLIRDYDKKAEANSDDS